MNRITGSLLVGVLLAFAVATGGCDRTRPYGGSAEPVSTPGGDAPPVVSEGTVAPTGPVQTAEGWTFTYSDPGATSVHLAGSFNDWSTTADPLKKGPDGVWTITKPLPAGSHQYKFVVNGSDWKPDAGNPQESDDGFGGKNSLLTVP